MGSHYTVFMAGKMIDRLKYIRAAEKPIRITDLAKKTGVSYPTISELVKTNPEIFEVLPGQNGREKLVLSRYIVRKNFHYYFEKARRSDKP